MSRVLFPIAASVAALVAAAAPASAATVITLTPAAGGTLTGGFEEVVVGGNVTTPASFTSTFSFTLPSDGVTSASLTSVATIVTTDIDFTSVLLNGQALTLTRNGPEDRAFIFSLPTTTGTQSLVVNGLVRGSGSFGGSISFSPIASPVPEPGTWALMLLGFGAIGSAMRRRRASVTRIGYKFA